MTQAPKPPATDLWDEWLQQLSLTELTGEGELPSWVAGSNLFE